MKTLSELLQAIASIAWPMIVVILLFRFQSAIEEIFASAKSRKFTIKVGGNELTMDEAAEQQSKLFADLQNQVVELKNRLDSITPPEQHDTMTALTNGQSKVQLILWVDDNPRNNSYEIDILQKMGVDITLSMSTKDAISRFNSRKFERIITDMGRFENGQYDGDAGIHLTTAIRQMDKTVPIIVYSSAKGITQKTIEAKEAGVTSLASTSIDLIDALALGNTDQKS